jgi:hypothetical protein
MPVKLDRIASIALAALALVAAPAPAQAQPAVPPSGSEAAGLVPAYSEDGFWLCLPGRDDACSRPLGTAALNSNGYGSLGQARPSRDSKADCFYIYPTVSRD